MVDRIEIGDNVFFVSPIDGEMFAGVVIELEMRATTDWPYGRKFALVKPKEGESEWIACKDLQRTHIPA